MQSSATTGHICPTSTERVKGLIRNMNVKHIAVNTLREMAKVSNMHLTMVVLPGREPDTAINVKHIAVNTLRGMAKVSNIYLTMMVLPGREPDTAINIMTRDRELGTR